MESKPIGTVWPDTPGHRVVTSVDAMQLRHAIWWGVGAFLVPLAAGQVLAAAPAGAPATVPPTVPPSVPPASSVPPTTVFAPAMGPLVPIPPGCTAPAPALAVFTGTIIAVDDPDHPSTVRYRVGTVLAGSIDGYLTAGTIDVRYGNEARFLTVGTEYIVGIGAEDGTGVIISRAAEQAPLFGGDAVIGVNDTDTACPVVEDPVRTLLADGASVETGVLSPLRGHTTDMVVAILKPLGLAMAALVALVTVKLLLFAAARGTRRPSAY